MKYLFLIFFSVTIFASTIETRFYGGLVEIDEYSGYYNGLVVKNSSEDETLSFQLGLKRIKIKDMNYFQNEFFIALEKEISWDSQLIFSCINIDQEKYGGSLYSLTFMNQSDSGMDLSVGGVFLDYDMHKVYQGDISLKNFIGQSPFYYKLKYTMNALKDSGKYKSYNAVDLDLGFIYSKFQGMISSFVGEKRYSLQENECFSWNVGYRHTSGFQSSLAYQLKINTLIKIDYLYSKMQGDNNNVSNLNVVNFVGVYRF